MKRILWKELREQAWFFAAGLLAPLVFLLHLRATDPTRPPWPTSASDLLLAFFLFAAWGATRLPHERRGGQLSLFTLPVPPWKVWAAKVLPAVLVAVAGAALALHLGIATSRDPLDAASRPMMTVGLGAGGLMLSFAIAFLASTAFSPAVSGILGAVIGLLGVDAAEALRITAPELLLSALIWAVVLLVLLLPRVLLRRNLSASRRAQGLVTAVCALLLGVGFVPYLSGTSFLMIQPEFMSDSDHEYPKEVLVSQDAGRVAFIREYYDRPEAAARKAEDDELWVARLDGSGRQRIADRGKLAPLAWTEQGTLVFQQFRGERGAVRWLRWSPSGGVRPLATVRFPTIDRHAPYIPYIATSPDGRWIAYLQPPRRAVMPLATPADLWMLDTATGRMRLLWPNVGDAKLSWRGGRIWIERGFKSFSIAPEGGIPRREEAISNTLEASR